MEDSIIVGNHKDAEIRKHNILTNAYNLDPRQIVISIDNYPVKNTGEWNSQTNSMIGFFFNQ